MWREGRRKREVCPTAFFVVFCCFIFPHSSRGVFGGEELKGERSGYHTIYIHKLKVFTTKEGG